MKIVFFVIESGAHVSSFMCVVNKSLGLTIRSKFSWWCSFINKRSKIISYKEYHFSHCQSVLSIVHKIKNHQAKNKFMNQGISAVNFTHCYRNTYNPASIRNNSQVNCIIVTLRFLLFVSYHIFAIVVLPKYICYVLNYEGNYFLYSAEDKPFNF